MSYAIEDFARDHNITPEENAQAVAQLRQDMRLYELREARRENGLTQAQLAERMGQSETCFRDRTQWRNPRNGGHTSQIHGSPRRTTRRHRNPPGRPPSETRLTATDAEYHIVHGHSPKAIVPIAPMDSHGNSPTPLNTNTKKGAGGMMSPALNPRLCGAHFPNRMITTGSPATVCTGTFMRSASPVWPMPCRSRISARILRSRWFSLWASIQADVGIPHRRCRSRSRIPRITVSHSACTARSCCGSVRNRRCGRMRRSCRIRIPLFP